MAAVLACGPDAVLSHRSAAQMWRLLPRSPGRSEVTRTRGWREPGLITVHRSYVPDDERTLLLGIPITGVSRTLLDLSAVLTKRQLERALNEAEVLGLTDRLSLPDLLGRHPGRRGSATLRTLLEDGTAVRGVTRSRLERRFLATLDRAGLPQPRLNADVAVRGRFFEADCLWLEQQVIVELDGREAHGTVRAFERDRERDRLLLVAGWRVTRVTWRQLRDDPAAVIADLRELLRS